MGALKRILLGLLLVAGGAFGGAGLAYSPWHPAQQRIGELECRLAETRTLLLTSDGGFSTSASTESPETGKDDPKSAVPPIAKKDDPKVDPPVAKKEEPKKVDPPIVAKKDEPKKVVPDPEEPIPAPRIVKKDEPKKVDPPVVAKKDEPKKVVPAPEEPDTLPRVAKKDEPKKVDPPVVAKKDEPKKVVPSPEEPTMVPRVAKKDEPKKVVPTPEEPSSIPRVAKKDEPRKVVPPVVKAEEPTETVKEYSETVTRCDGRGFCWTETVRYRVVTKTSGGKTEVAKYEWVPARRGYNWYQDAQWAKITSSDTAAPVAAVPAPAPAPTRAAAKTYMRVCDCRGGCYLVEVGSSTTSAPVTSGTVYSSYRTASPTPYVMSRSYAAPVPMWQNQGCATGY